MHQIQSSEVHLCAAGAHFSPAVESTQGLSNIPVLCCQLVYGLCEACEGGAADVQEGVHLGAHGKALLHLVHKLRLAGLQASGSSSNSNCRVNIQGVGRAVQMSSHQPWAGNDRQAMTDRRSTQPQQALPALYMYMKA
jgi:hypothetical protein